MKQQTTIRKPKLDSAYIHDYDKKLESLYRRLETELSEQNRQTIKDYDTNAVNQGIGKAARIKHIQVLLQLSPLFNNKNWKDITKSEIGSVIVQIMDKHSSKGQETNTTYDFKKVIKIFFRWLKLGHRHHKTCLIKFRIGDPPETEDIVTGRPEDNIVREDLITPDERTRLLRACGENLRDKAMIDSAIDAGGRAGERLSVQLKHIKSDDYGAVIAVDGKTGARPIRLIESAPNLFAWINAHPFRDDPEAPLCMDLSHKNYGRPMKYQAARQMLIRICKKADLRKRVYFTLFRHTEATNSANFLTEAQMKKRHGWSKNSQMASRYTHLVDADVEQAFLQHYGLKKEEDPDKARLPKICPICKNPNAWDSKLCSNCGKPLDLITAIELEEKENSQREKNERRLKAAEVRLEKVLEIMEILAKDNPRLSFWWDNSKPFQYQDDL